MDGFWSWFAGLLIGFLLSYWLSAYFFRRSLTKSLTPYLHFSSAPFEGIAPDTRESLNVTYFGESVKDLYEIQFIVANTGDKAIRDLIEPLRLSIPDDSALLNATVLYQHPSQLKIVLQVADDNKLITLNFPLLNKGDYFVLKVLLNGVSDSSKFEFSIVVDELPPVLPIKRISYDEISSPNGQESVVIEFLAFGMVALFFGLVLCKVIYDAWPSLPGSPSFSLSYVESIGFTSVAVWLAMIPAVFLILTGALATNAAFSWGFFPTRKRKFILPKGIADAPLAEMFRPRTSLAVSKQVVNVGTGIEPER